MDHLKIDADQAYNTSRAVGNDAQELREELGGLQRDWDNLSREWSGVASSAYDQRVRRECDGSRIRGQRRHDQDWYGVHPMKDQTSWRPISSEEAAVIRSILSQADIRRSGPLIADLDGALVANETAWILDVKLSNKGEARRSTERALSCTSIRAE